LVLKFHGANSTTSHVHALKSIMSQLKLE